MATLRRGLARVVVAGCIVVAGVLSIGVLRAGAEPVRGPAGLRFGVALAGGAYDREGLDGIARDVGDRPSVELIYADFGQDAPIAALDEIASRGAEAIVTWEPWLWGAGQVQDGYALDRIAAGEYDVALTAWATAVAAWGRPVTVRFAHEMNGFWYPWAAGVNGNEPGDYIDAWRHVHDVVGLAGARNVSWLWSPNVPFAGSTPIGDLYPGDDYVDLVGLDGYNWGTSQTWSSWTSPVDLLAPGLAQLRDVAPGKPIVISEIATAGEGGSKADWIGQAIAFLDAQPDVVGFVWFNLPKEADWRLNDTPQSAAAFRSALEARTS